MAEYDLDLLESRLPNAAGDIGYIGATAIHRLRDSTRRLREACEAQARLTAYYNGQSRITKEKMGPNGVPLWTEYLCPEARAALSPAEPPPKVRNEIPSCPECGQKMVSRTGFENSSELSVPHWRCETWTGNEMCGETIVKQPAEPKVRRFVEHNTFNTVWEWHENRILFLSDTTHTLAGAIGLVDRGYMHEIDPSGNRIPTPELQPRAGGKE